MDEVWKDVVGYEGLYMVSNTGKVYSCIRNKIMTDCDSHGYRHLGLTKKGKERKHVVHRLVAQAFIPNPFGKPEINHIDENKTNNHVDNLNWCTRTENLTHGTFIERRKRTISTSEKWDAGVKRKYKSVIGVHVETNDTIELSCMTIGNSIGFSNDCISKCIRGDCMTHKGFKWYLKSDYYKKEVS